MQKKTRKLTRTSKHSYYVVIPKEIIEKYGWRQKQRMVIVDKRSGRIEIRDWRKR